MAVSLVEPMQHDSEVHSVVFSPDGTRLATTSLVATDPFAMTVRLWDPHTGLPLGEPMRDEGATIAFSSDGTHLISTSRRNTSKLWDGHTGAPIGKPVRHDRTGVALAISLDATRLAMASDDNTVLIWNTQTDLPLGEPMLHEGGVRSIDYIAFSPDGTHLAIASFKAARVWDPQTGLPLGEPMRHEGRVVSVAFSLDGTRLATASADKTARLWDANTGLPLGEPLRHEDGVYSIAISPDGTILATSSSKTARIWEPQTGLPLGEPMRHEGDIYSVAFSPDGTRLATASADKTARLWDVETIVPANFPAFINRFAKKPDPSIPPDTEFQAELESFQAGRDLRYRQSTAIKAVKEKNWFVANFYLSWLVEHEPKNPRWQALLEETNAAQMNAAPTVDAVVQDQPQASNDRTDETLTGTVSDVRVSAGKDAAAVFIKIDEQNTVIVMVPPAIYAAITSTGTVLSAESLLGKTVHATGKTEPYAGGNEAWRKMQQLTIESPEAVQVMK